MDNREVGRVTEVSLGFEDHGIFGFDIEFEYADGTFQGTGWYGFGTGPATIIRSIMNSFGVTEWTKIADRTVWVHRKEGRIMGWEPLMSRDGGRPLMLAELFDGSF